MRHITFNKRFRDIFLILTEFCPNRCVYCYIKNKDRREIMPMEHIDKLISSFEFNKPRLIFFGGEPLVELELMEKILAKYWNSCRFQVVTSATVNYERFIEELFPKYPIAEIQLSWDGAGNSNRPHFNGSYLQDEVWQKIVWTLKRKVAIDIKCVVNDENVSNLEQTYFHFKELKYEYPKLVHGDFVIAHQKEFKKDFASKLRNGLKRSLFNIKQDLAKSLVPYIPRDWLNKIIAVIAKDNNISSCDAGNYVVMRPNGDLYPCTIFSQLDYQPFKIGNISDKEINDKVFDLIKKKCSHENCQNCLADCLCDGGCRYERYLAKQGKDFNNYYCRHQCDAVHVFYEEISQWLKILSFKEKMLLINYLKIYQRWSLNYNLPR